MAADAVRVISVIGAPAALLVGLAQNWEALVETHSERKLMVWGLFAVVMATYWSFGLLCLGIDTTETPKPVWSSRLQPRRHDARTPSVSRLCVVVLLNQLTILLPFSHLQYELHSRGVWSLGLRVHAGLPAVSEVAMHLLGLALLEEVCFYYSHRLLHTTWLYRWVHSTHHDFHAPTALATIYAHPFEVATSNVLPLILGPLALNCHLYTTVVWYVLAVLGSQWHHCGYSWPMSRTCAPGVLAPQPYFHDWHHERGGGAPGGGNYGLLGLLDLLHGTDCRWRRECRKSKKKAE